MNKIDLLQIRRNQILEAGKEVRKTISELIDAESFVELSGYSFSKKDFYGEEAEGEGVVTGFATLDGYGVYIVAQNVTVKSGGISKANADKIVKCMEAAEKSESPIIYILNTLGVQVGEGVNALEGIAAVLSKACDLCGNVPQFSIINGECYGQISLLAGLTDMNFMLDNSVIAVNSPFVISAASGKNLDKKAVGGAKAVSKSGLVTFNVKDIAEIRDKILTFIDLIDNKCIDEDLDLNTTAENLNSKTNLKDVIEALFDGKVLELGESNCPEVKCLLGRVGGYSVACVAMDGGTDGVELNAENAAKISSFVSMACDGYGLPVINLVNAKGLKADMETACGNAMNNVCSLIYNYGCAENAISVIYGKAIGLGYTVFAAKNSGYDYSCAFANAEISVVDAKVGAEIEFATQKADKAALAEKYASENSDPVNAAKDGYIDDIIEPAFVKQYVVSALQMLVR